VIIRALIRLLTLAALAVAGWWVARLFGAGRRRDSGPRRQVRASDGPMVRDRVCNTFLPRSRALELQVGGDTHYFCSESCRHRFSEEKEAGRPA
jgi:YHS domain-containing protein